MEQYLDALLRSMDEKTACLELLLEKTAAQAEILAAEAVDWDAFDALIDEKAELIDRLEVLDDGFVSVFDRIKDELETKKDAYKPQIARLKEQIKKVTEQSASLMANEKRNQEQMTKQTGAERKRIRETRSRSKAAASYYKSMNQINYVDPQLMDKKK